MKNKSKLLLIVPTILCLGIAACTQYAPDYSKLSCRATLVSTDEDRKESTYDLVITNKGKYPAMVRADQGGDTGPRVCEGSSWFTTYNFKYAVFTDELFTSRILAPGETLTYRGTCNKKFNSKSFSSFSSLCYNEPAEANFVYDATAITKSETYSSYFFDISGVRYKTDRESVPYKKYKLVCNAKYDNKPVSFTLSHNFRVTDNQKEEDYVYFSTKNDIDLEKFQILSIDAYQETEVGVRYNSLDRFFKQLAAAVGKLFLWAILLFTVVPGIIVGTIFIVKGAKRRKNRAKQ